MKFEFELSFAPLKINNSSSLKKENLDIGLEVTRSCHFPLIY